MDTEYLRIRIEAIDEAINLSGKLILEHPQKTGKCLSRKPFRQHGRWYVRVGGEYLELKGYQVNPLSSGRRQLIFTTSLQG